MALGLQHRNQGRPQPIAGDFIPCRFSVFGESQGLLGSHLLHLAQYTAGPGDGKGGVGRCDKHCLLGQGMPQRCPPSHFPPSFILWKMVEFSAGQSPEPGSLPGKPPSQGHPQWTLFTEPTETRQALQLSKLANQPTSEVNRQGHRHGGACNRQKLRKHLVLAPASGGLPRCAGQEGRLQIQADWLETSALLTPAMRPRSIH